MEFIVKRIEWISAAAGSGKTYYIISSICKLLLQGVKGNEILCISFTNVAAKEMEMRLHSIMQSASRGIYADELVNLTIPHNINEIVKNFYQYPVNCFTIHGLAMHHAKKLHQSVKILAPYKSSSMVNEAIELTLREKLWRDLCIALSDERMSIVKEITSFIMSNQLKYLLNEYKVGNKAWPIMTFPKGLYATLYSTGYKNIADILQSGDKEQISKLFLTQTGGLKEGVFSSAWIGRNRKEYSAIHRFAHDVFAYSQSHQNYRAMKKSHVLTEWIKAICFEYKKLKQNNNVWDFSDMLSYLTEIIDVEYSINCFSYLFLDEAQDLSEAQWNIVQLLCKNIMDKDKFLISIVGDSKQNIYSFQGATANLMKDAKVYLQKLAKQQIASFENISLHHSYRSGELLLNFVSNTMLNFMPIEQHVAAKQMKSYVHVWKKIKKELELEQGWCPKVDTSKLLWVDLCVNEIKKLLNTKLLNENRKVEYEDILILIRKRTNQHSILISKLEANDIPIAVSPFPFYSNLLVQDLVNIIILMRDIDDDFMLAGLLKNAYFAWTDEDLIKFVSNRTDSLYNNLLENKSNEKVEYVLNTLSRWKQYPLHVYEFFQKLIFHDEFGRFFINSSDSDIILHFWEQVVQFDKISSSIIDFIHWIKSINSIERKGVRISTIHGAKGAEAPIVILCDSYQPSPRNMNTLIVHQGSALWPRDHPMYYSLKKQNLQNQNIEQNNLLYVALTRAKEQLYILPPVYSTNSDMMTWYSKICSTMKEIGDEHDEYYSLGCAPLLIDIKKQSMMG